MIIKKLFLFSFILTISTICFAQDNNSFLEIEDIAKYIEVNNTKAIKVFSQYGSTYIGIQTINNEDALAFSVFRVGKAAGVLYVTKSKIIFISRNKKGDELPNLIDCCQNSQTIDVELLNQKNSFNLSKTGLNEVKFEKNEIWILKDNLAIYGSKLSLNHIELKTTLALYWYPNNSVLVKSALNDEKQYIDRATRFLSTAITDFDSAYAKINQLVDRGKSELKNKKLAEFEIEKEFREKIEDIQKKANEREIYDKKVKSIIQKKESQLINVSEQDKKKVELALRELKKMSAATEIGINLSAYNSRLIDTKVIVDEAISVLPDNYLRKEFELALQSFIDVSKAWNEIGSNNNLYPLQDIFWILLDRYGLQLVSESNQSLKITKNDIFSVIWKKSSNHVNNIDDLISL